MFKSITGGGLGLRGDIKGSWRIILAEVLKIPLCIYLMLLLSSTTGSGRLNLRS